MSVKSNFRRLKHEEKGSVVIIIAFLMTIILGMSAIVLDLGNAYLSKSKLQKSMDSIALAAVRELPTEDLSTEKWQNAKDAAEKYAQLNGVINFNKETDVEPVYYNDISINKIIGIKVEGKTNVNYNFAYVFGKSSGIVNASATAELLTVKSKDKIIPFALGDKSFEIIKNNLSATQPIYFDSNHNTETGGWFGILNVDKDAGNNGSQGTYTKEELDAIGVTKAYQAALVNGSRNGVEIGQIIDMELGSQGNLVKEAYDKRILGHEKCDYIGGRVINTLTGDPCLNCPRVVTVPIMMEKSELQSASDTLLSKYHLTRADVNKIIDDLSNNKKEVFVVALATVFLDDMVVKADTNGNKYQMLASYISSNVVNGDAEVGNVVNDYGVLAAKLVD